MLYRLTQCSPIRDYRIPQFVEPWCGIWWIYSSRFDTFLNLVGLVGYNIILTALKPLWSFYQLCTKTIRGSLIVFCILTFGFCCLVPLFLCYPNQMIFRHVVLVLISCTCVFCIGSGPVSSRICWSPFQWSSETAASQPDLLAPKVLISSPPSCLQPSSSNKSTSFNTNNCTSTWIFVILVSMRHQPDLLALKVLISHGLPPPN